MSVATKEFVYDAANEVLVLRAAVAYAIEDRPKFRALVHSIGEDEFLVPQHCSLWRCLRRIADDALEYTPETMRSLASTEPTVPDEDHLAEIESTATVAQNIEWHVQTLRWDATRARVVKGSLPELVRDLSDPRVTVDRAVSSARSVVRALEGGGGRRFIHRKDELSALYKTELQKRRETKNFFPTGWDPVDARMTEGFMPGNTILVAGLSGSGKSTWSARLAIMLAKLGRRVLMCVWEMGGISTIDVLASSLTGIELERVVQGTYDDAEQLRLQRASDWATRRITFMEHAFFGEIAQTRGKDGKGNSRRSNDRNQDILEGYIAESGCDVVIMDLWERMLADTNPDGVSGALIRQQQMHREYGVCGIIIQQLNLKDVEKREDKRPTREAIKGVGTYVEVSDLIFGVHRDAQFKDVPDDTIELICLKQRKGRGNWAVRFGWDGATCQITGGEEVPYNPGLEATSEYGDVSDPSAIRTRPRNNKLNRRDS